MRDAAVDYADLVSRIRQWGKDLGFQQIGITGIELSAAERYLVGWLDRGYHGEMHYMNNHGVKRCRPELLVTGTHRVITARMDYLSEQSRDAGEVLDDNTLGYVSRYALGRDYHKLIRNRLQKLAGKIARATGPFGYRVFTDSAPVMEKPLAEKAGLGWIGKHTNLINKKAGSWFFLGEIYTDLPLPTDDLAQNHCGSCQACIDVCPTNAIIAPYQLDARLCISYLTIELRGSIPEHLRPLIGNRIFGCDDCQLVCPWNKYARPTQEKDFFPRHTLDAPTLIELFSWTEETFLQKTKGSAIRRIGYECWLRNIAVALGNAAKEKRIIEALEAKRNHPSPLVLEHVLWALNYGSL